MCVYVCVCVVCVVCGVLIDYFLLFQHQRPLVV